MNSHHEVGHDSPLAMASDKVDRPEDLQFDKSLAAFFGYFFKRQPLRSLAMVVLLVLSGLAEGIGLMALLPMLRRVTDLGGTGAPAGWVSQQLAAIGMIPSLELFLAVIAAAFAIKGCLLYLAMRQVGITLASVAAELRRELVDTVLSADWQYFTGQPMGHIVNAVGIETHRAAWAYRDGCAAIAGAVLVVVYAAVLIVLSWQVALFSTLGALALMLGLRPLMRTSRHAGSGQTASTKALVARLSELLPSMKAVKAMGRDQHLSAMMHTQTDKIETAQRSAILAWELLRCSREPILVAVICFGIFLAMTVFSFEFAFVLLLAAMFYRIMLTFGDMQAQLQTVIVGQSAFWSVRSEIKRARAHHDVTPLPQDAATTAPMRLTKSIELKGVSLRLRGRTILEPLTLAVSAGKIVALRGPSGAGKTSLVDLIIGLQKPTEGTIEIDGHALTAQTLPQWRKHIGYVPQDVFLLNDTVRNNITLGADSFDQAAVEHAAVSAGLSEVLSALPGGLDYNVGERGAQLSGGQAQRVAIARALISKPSLLVLDEATAHLDAAVEAEIFQTLRALTPDVTILLIGHGEAVTAVADGVVTVAGGKITSATLVCDAA